MDATSTQPRPHGLGRDIGKLVQEDILTRPVLVPEEGFKTVALWVRSAAAYLKSRQLEERTRKEFEGECCPELVPPSILEIARGLSEDLAARIDMGEKKYGERLRAFNGRDAKLDAYQELLDAWDYLRQDEEESEVKR